MYGIYESVWKMELQEGKTLSRLPWIWISMDIYVWLISDLGQPRKYDISGIRIINDFTICGCVEDADILLLLRMFYDFLFFFSSYSSLFLAEFTLASPLWKWAR